jgi:hypothetical protein
MILFHHFDSANELPPPIELPRHPQPLVPEFHGKLCLTDAQRQPSCKPTLQILQNEGTALAMVYGLGYGRQAAETRFSSNFNTKKQGAAGISNGSRRSVLS